MTQRFRQSRHLVATAPGRAELSQALGEALAQLLPGELLTLPEGVAAALVSDATAIPGVAFELTRVELAYVGPPDVQALLREVTLLYVAAAQRLANIDTKARITDP